MTSEVLLNGRLNKRSLLGRIDFFRQGPRRTVTAKEAGSITEIKFFENDYDFFRLRPFFPGPRYFLTACLSLIDAKDKSLFRFNRNVLRIRFSFRAVKQRVFAIPHAKSERTVTISNFRHF